MVTTVCYDQMQSRMNPSPIVFRHDIKLLVLLVVLSKCTRGVARLQEQRTATYCAGMTENGDLSLGLGDRHNSQQITEQYVSISEAGTRHQSLHISSC